MKPSFPLRRPLLALGLLAASLAASAQTLVHEFSFSSGVQSIVNGTTTATGSLVGGATVANGALKLQGPVAYVNLAPVIPVVGDYNASFWTVSVWARQTASPIDTFTTLVSQGAVSGYMPDYTLGLTANANGSGGVTALNRSGWSGGAWGSVADVGEWNLFTTVMSHTTVTLYVNGSLASSGGQGQHPCCFTSQSARLGRDVDGGGAGGQFTGEIDDLRIYSGALSSTAIAAQYAAGRTAPVPEPSSLLLWCGGLLGLGALTRRRLRAAGETQA